jgi:1-acyl-sn-glycerol-3-phosphate acyltransferase
VGLTRVCCLIFNVRVHCADPDKLRTHRGFVFPNHSSFLDSISLLSITPLRFLAAAELRSYPAIGWFASNLGTVFVARENKSSRKQSRQEIVEAIQQEPYPALVLFPEGKLGSGTDMHPFRFGAFEIAAKNGIAYLPCAIRYTRPDIAVWHGGQGEVLMAAAWRLACFAGPIGVEVTPLTLVTPGDEADPAQLAETAQSAIREQLLARPPVAVA